MLIIPRSSGPRRHARAVFILGIACLVLAILWTRIADTLATSMGPDARDTVRGLLYGLSFGLLLVSLFARRRLRE